MEPYDKTLYLHRMFLSADRETLNSFEKQYYDLYKQYCSKANGIFFLKEEQDPHHRIVDGEMETNPIERVRCFNNGHTAAVRHNVECIPKNVVQCTEPPSTVVTITDLYDGYTLELVTVAEYYHDKLVLVMFVSYEEEVGTFTSKKNTTPYTKSTKHVIPLVRILDQNKNVLFDKYFHKKKYKLNEDNTLSVCSNWFNQHLFHLNNFIIVLCEDIVKIDLETFETVENTAILPQGMVAQNKTNYLYVGTTHGRIDVLNIKTLHSVKHIEFYGVKHANRIHDVDIMSLKLIRDTLYVYAFEDWSGGVDRIFTIDDVNNVVQNELKYSACDLSNTYFSKYIEHYGKYLYISSNCQAGTVIFDRHKGRVVKLANTLIDSHAMCDNLFKIQDHYLIISIFIRKPIVQNEFSGHIQILDYTIARLQVFDLNENPLLSRVDYEYESTNKHFINVRIVEHHICIEYMYDGSIVMERIPMKN